MELFGLSLSEWLLPIVIGVVAGLLTNAIAIWMLFHPYRPLYLGRLRVLPMGAIPSEIDRIARRIGEIVGEELLTPEDIARTLASDAFRERFDEALREALVGLANRDLGSLRELVSPAQAAGLERMLARLLAKLLEVLQVYLESPEWEERVRRFARDLTGEFRDRPFAVVLTPELRRDLGRAARELWTGVRDSRELERLVVRAVEHGVRDFMISRKPLRRYLPGGAVHLGEAFVRHYLPPLLERLGQVLADPLARQRVQATLRQFAERVLREQQTWKRLVGRLVITERALAQAVDALEQGGVDEISALLRDPVVQQRLAAALNEGVDELLDRPVRELLGGLPEERAERVRAALTERALYLLRHPTTEDLVLRQLEDALFSAAGRTVGDVLDLLGEERGRAMSHRIADRVIGALRGPRARRIVRSAVEDRTSWLLGIPIGRPADYLPPDALERAEALLFDPLWAFLQQRVPLSVATLPVARMVEDKLRSYPIARVEELIWRLSRDELVLIVHLGGFLGALIGSVMLFLSSWPAGLAATGFFVALSLVFINLKGAA